MKILIVDDSAENRYLLEVILRSHGHQAVFAENGLEALERLHDEGVDLIVSDILMPKMDGYRLCRECKQDDRLRTIPFVFVTASYTEDKDEQFALGLGAERFIRRPVEPDTFMQAIDEVIANGAAKPVSAPVNGGYLAAYAERVVHKLEEKIGALEAEIAARRRAEAALRESEEKFRSFAEAADQVFWITGVQPERLVYANPSFERIWGRDVQDLYADPRLWLQSVHPDDRAGIARAFEQWIQGLPDTRYEVEYRIVRPDGAVRWISDCGFVIPGETDLQLRVAGIAEDVTERKQAGEALRESEERYRSLTAALVEGVILMDANGTIRACNGSAERILGLAVDKTRGRTLFDTTSPPIHEDGTPYTVDALPQNVALNTGQPCRGVILGLRRRDGSIAWLSANAQPLLRPGDAKAYAVVASFSDITEQKLLERELQQQARTDALTGVANRRHFMEEAEQALAVSRRYGHALSLLMIDIDRFKLVNDTYGHHVGDLTLQMLAAVCRRELRDVDLFGRIGGEEFAVMLPETGAQRALRVAERLRTALAGAVVRIDDRLSIRFTVSIGVATLNARDPSMDTFLQRADQALYEAKQSGRDTVRTAKAVLAPAAHSLERL